MPRIVHPYFVPTSIDRPASPQTDSGGYGASRALAGMLLAAVVAALMVIADQLIDTWAEGHLLLVWVALWSVAFAGLAFLAPVLRRVSKHAADALTHWSEMRSERKSDALIWRVAQQDYRVMRELQLAALHAESQS